MLDGFWEVGGFGVGDFWGGEGREEMGLGESTYSGHCPRIRLMMVIMFYIL